MNTKDKLLGGEILVLDDALPKSLFSRIKNKVYDSMFWSYMSQTGLGKFQPKSGISESKIKKGIYQTKYSVSKYDSETTSFDDTYSFGNNIFLIEQLGQPTINQILPQFFDNTELALAIVADNINIKIQELIRIRSGLITNTNRKHFQFPHIDMESHHFNALLYLTTCDAPTRIFKETYDFNYKKNINDRSKGVDFLYEKYDGVLNTNCEIDSVENRIVIFYGNYYHSSSSPIDVDRRIVLNYNFIC